MTPALQLRFEAAEPAPRAQALGPWLGWGAFAVALAFVVLRPFVDATGVLVLYVAFNALFNLPHQYCTWVRAVRDPVRPAIWHTARVGGVALLGLAAVWLVHADLLGPTRVALLTNALPYWGLWHLVAQHGGISGVLRRRTQEPAAGRADRTFFLILFALGALHLHAVGALTFHVGSSVTTMARLPLPAGAGWLTAGLYGVVCGVFLVPAWRANPLRARYQSLVAVATFAAFFCCDDLLLTTASITALHNVHYIGLVGGYQERRAKTDPTVRALGWRDVAFAALYSALVHGVFVVSVPAGEVVLATLVALHYFADGRLWRFRKDRGLVQHLV